MKKPIENIKVRGRFLGVFIVVIIQSLVGFIHIFFGSILLLGSYVPVSSSSTLPIIYSLYTMVYGILTTFFAGLFWKEKRLGWIGTIAVSLFVILVDTLALFDLFNFLGIPKTAGLGEIPYSLILLFYLFEEHIRLKYNI
jgi:hypothetical protein